MKITWYGHAAFLIEGEGKRVILDPYTSPKAGFEPIDDSANVVVISHHNETYHSGLSQIREPYVLVEGLELFEGGREECGIHFDAVKVFEDASYTDPIAMVYFELEGIRVCHMGDLGHMPSPEQIEPIRQVDVLLALAGGPPTIELSDLAETLELIQPRITIPMHFKTRNIMLPIRPLDDFLTHVPPHRVHQQPGSCLDLTRDSIPAEPTIQVLAPAR